MPARYHTHLALCAGSRRVRLRCALRMPIMRRMQECAPNGMRRSGLGRNQRRLSTSRGTDREESGVLFAAASRSNFASRRSTSVVSIARS